jgi:transposase
MIDEVLTITAVSIQVSPCCPLCGTPALRVHSRYTRQITDLPCSGQQVRLLVQVRKCFCQGPGCAREIFLERLTPFVEPWARVTRRLYQIVQILGLATGGRLGIRVQIAWGYRSRVTPFSGGSWRCRQSQLGKFHRLA